MNISRNFILIAIIYACLGMSLGFFMGLSNDSSYMHLHAHINVIGWITMALFGLIYKNFPKMEESTIGKVHFYVANIGAAAMLTGIYAFIRSGFEPLVAFGATFTCLSIFIFLFNFVKNGK